MVGVADTFPESLPAFQRMFPDDVSCARYLESVRWREGFVCVGGNPTPGALLPGEVFTFGMPLYVNAADGKLYKAGATAAANTSVAALVVQSYETPGGGVELLPPQLLYAGPLTLTTAQWDAIVTGQSGGLTPGSYYYLSGATAGFLTTEPPVPDGQWVLKIGLALSPTTLLVQIGTPVENVG